MTAILIIITTNIQSYLIKYSLIICFAEAQYYYFLSHNSPNFQSFCNYSLNLGTIWYIPITLKIDVNLKIKKKIYKMWGLKGQKFLFYACISIFSSIHIFFMDHTSFCLLGMPKILYFKENLLYSTLFALLAHTYDFII